jgi:hypothetical protein
MEVIDLKRIFEAMEKKVKILPSLSQVSDCTQKFLSSRLITMSQTAGEERLLLHPYRNHDWQGTALLVLMVLSSPQTLGFQAQRYSFTP